jgi:hypothetical protein
MSAHRLISTDDGVECFRCGLTAETDQDGEHTAAQWPCRISTEHPAHLLADGTVETCAAHPYAGCAPVLPADDIAARFDAAGVDPFPSWVENAGRWS